MSLPTQQELANIVYRSSFGFRAGRHSLASSPLIREARLATAVAVVNRARQGMRWGAQGGTESSLNPPETGGSALALSQLGNRAAYTECLEVASDALGFATLPLDDWMVWEGSQYYRHTHQNPPRRWQSSELYTSYGPMVNFAGRQFYLGIYIDRARVRRYVGGVHEMAHETTELEQELAQAAQRFGRQRGARPASPLRRTQGPALGPRLPSRTSSTPIRSRGGGVRNPAPAQRISRSQTQQTPPVPTATPRVLTYTPQDVIDPRISTPAQSALVRMSKNPATSADAVGMLEEIKAGRLAGIYCVNWEKAAQRALKLGKNWWTVIPQGEDAILMMAPTDEPDAQPLIAFRRELDYDCGRLKGERRSATSPSRLIVALLQAWQPYVHFRRGEIGCFPLHNGQIYNAFRTNQKDLQAPNNDTPNNVVCGPDSVCGLGPGKDCICHIPDTCPNCRCKIADNCSLKCPSRPIVRRLSFAEMWEMIMRHYYCELPPICKCPTCCKSPNELCDIFSPELMIAIFWEESRFRNIPQDPCGTAVGFGQVEPQDMYLTLNRCGIRVDELKEQWSTRAILCDEAKAIQIAGMTLWRLFCAQPQSRSTDAIKVAQMKYTALLNYAGLCSKCDQECKNCNPADWKQQRTNIVKGWLECEKYLKNIRAGTVPKTQTNLINALNLAAKGKPAQIYRSADDFCVFPNGQLPDLKYPSVSTDDGCVFPSSDAFVRGARR